MPRPTSKQIRENDRRGFVQSCVPVVIADGTTNIPAQAVAICNSIWERDSRNKRKGNS